MNLSFLRAYVRSIRMHFDPIGMIVDSGEIVVAYGMATSDLLRLKSSLSDLNRCGLILVNRKNDRFRFLVFREMVVAIYPGFKEAIEGIGLICGYDFQLKDIAKLGDYQQLSKWITLKETERLDAENRARAIGSLIERSRLHGVLGPRAIEIIRDLMWATNVFEPLHALTVIAKTIPSQIDVVSLRNDLRKIGADLIDSTHSTNRFLARRRSNITLMDCARFLFTSGNYYFESKSSELSKTLGMPTHKLPSHFRGYLIVDDTYVNKLIEASQR